MNMSLKLNNGVTIPALGFGVFQTAPEDTAHIVRTALDTGYRHIDTAAAYLNEAGVGEGIRQSGIPREDIFIESKVWVSDYGFDATLHAFEKSSRKIGFEVIDLLLLHQPMPQHFDRTREAYRALEKLLEEGRVRSIGVSNFLPRHVDELMKSASVIPAVNQSELHPYFSQPGVRAADEARGTLTQAWSPIGGITFYQGPEGDRKSVLNDPVITSIAATHGRSPAQVILRWHLQQGRSAIPKSGNAKRIAENFAVFDFNLSDEDMSSIDALDTGRRSGPDPDTRNPLDYGLEIPEA